MSSRLPVKQHRKCFTLALFFAFLGAVVLSIESYLNLRGSSICKTSACEVVGNYLTIPESILVTLGAALLWSLVLLLFFLRRYKSRFIYFPLLLLAPALAFDGVLIGYQIFTINEFCLLCMGVALFLFTITILYGLANRFFFITLLCVFVWFGGFGASSIMKLPQPRNGFEQIAFWESIDPNLKLNNKRATVTLIFSMECPHCLHLISYLARSDYKSVNWRLASIDQNRTQIGKINIFLKNLSPKANFFDQLLTVKKSSYDNQAVTSELIESKNEMTLSFLSTLAITHIPVVVIETADKKKEIIWGVEPIKKRLQIYFDPK